MHTLNVNHHVKASNIKCKLKHQISIMVLCGDYVVEFSVNKDMKKQISMIPYERSASEKVGHHPKIISLVKIHASHEGMW